MCQKIVGTLPNNLRIRVALYIRVSTEEQAKHGLSLADQREALIAYAAAHSMEVVGIYEDAGISARKPYKKRPSLMRLLDDCRAGKIDTILFVKLDRWFRNVAGYYAVQDVLDKNHVAWQAIREDYETRTASGRLKVNIMLSVAQDEADRTSERIKAINEGKRAKGQPTNGRTPIGIKTENRAYVIDEENADIARDMFSAFIRLQSVLALRRYMAETWSVRRSYNKYKQALSNHLYIGEAFGIENALPPLIDRETFDLAGELLQRRSQRNAGTDDRVYLFSGLLRCRECGRTMQSETVKKVYTYYRCRTHMLDPADCPHTLRIREDVLEEYLLKEITGISERYYSKARSAQKKPAKTAEQIRRKMQKLKELYLSDLIELDDYRRDYTELKQQLTQSEPQEEKAFDIDALRRGLEAYPGLDRQGKKEFWTRTIKRLEADNNGAFFVTPV